MQQQTPTPWAQSAFNTQNYVSQKSQTMQNNNPNCYMEFDGQNLNLYNKRSLTDSLDAMSGREEYQARKYQNIRDKGPIPEGIYYANQNQRQTITAKDAAIGAITKLFNINGGKWKGSIPAWGLHRVWLEPDQNTNTYGRDGFSIHGGLSKGSAGCIDIPWQTSKLSNYMDNCQDTIPVYVNYPKEQW